MSAASTHGRAAKNGTMRKEIALLQEEERKNELLLFLSKWHLATSEGEREEENAAETD